MTFCEHNNKKIIFWKNNSKQIIKNDRYIDWVYEWSLMLRLYNQFLKYSLIIWYGLINLIDFLVAVVVLL